MNLLTEDLKTLREMKEGKRTLYSHEPLHTANKSVFSPHTFTCSNSKVWENLVAVITFPLITVHHYMYISHTLGINYN